MSRPLRILHVIPTLEVGGAEVFVTQLAAAQQAAGHEVHILHLYAGGPLIDRLDATLRSRVHHIAKRARYDATAIPRIAALMRRLRPDVVHTHLFTALTWAGVAAKLARVPAWVTTHHAAQAIDGADSRVVERVWTRRADVSIACSEATAELLRSWSRPGDEVLVIPNGIPLQGRPRSPLIGEPPVIGTVGRMSPVKAQDTLIEAVGHLRERGIDVQLRLIGDGDLRGDLEALTDRLDLRDRVTFVGKVSDVPDQLVALDLFVLPSLSEAMPLALLEACAAGLPVLVTDRGGAGRLLEQGAGGWLVTPGSGERLADAIARFAALGLDERKALGDASYRTVLKHYDMQACADAYERAYQQALGRAGWTRRNRS